MTSTEDARMVRYMLLADSAEVVNGKHYMLGGGFNVIGSAVDPPVVRPQISIVLRIDIPWKATTPAQHTLVVDILDADGHSILSGRPEAKFEAGRPPGMRSDDIQVMPVVFNLLNVSFPAFGIYRVACLVDGTEQTSEKLTVSRVGAVASPA